MRFLNGRMNSSRSSNSKLKTICVEVAVCSSNSYEDLKVSDRPLRPKSFGGPNVVISKVDSLRMPRSSVICRAVTPARTGPSDNGSNSMTWGPHRVYFWKKSWPTKSKTLPMGHRTEARAVAEIDLAVVRP